ncbi:unnamed protein product, partial [Allacma fusca]
TAGDPVVEEEVPGAIVEVPVTGKINGGNNGNGGSTPEIPPVPPIPPPPTLEA